MFIPAIKGQGTAEQQDRWLPLAKTLQIVGTYAQVSMLGGHVACADADSYSCSDLHPTDGAGPRHLPARARDNGNLRACHGRIRLAQVQLGTPAPPRVYLRLPTP